MSSVMQEKLLSVISSLTTKPRKLGSAMAVLTCFKMVALLQSCAGTVARKWILRDLVCKTNYHLLPGNQQQGWCPYAP